MNRSELADQCILLNELDSLRELVRRFDSQPQRAAAGLEAFRGGVSEALSSRLSACQMGELANLKKALSREADPVILWRDHGEVIDQKVENVRELAANNEALQRVLQTEHHDWRNAVTLLVQWEQVEDARRRCAEWLERSGADGNLPDLDRLKGLLEAEEPAEEVAAGLTTYFGEHAEELQTLFGEAESMLASWDQYAEPEHRRKGWKIRHILVVEDELGWRKDVEHLARAVAAEVGGARVSTAAHCTEARAFVSEHVSEGVLAVCDIGLPADAEEAAAGKWHEEKGWVLVQEFSKQCRVIALTSLSRLDRDFVKLRGHADDFLLKESADWRADLQQRLEARLRPLSPQRLELVVPVFDAERVLVSGVWVRLKPLAFAIVDALAFGWRETPEDFFERAPRFAERRQQPREGGQQPLTLEQLKVVMCRREVTDLKPDFIHDFDVKQLKDHLREIAAAVGDAFEEQGLTIEAREFIRVGERGGEMTVTLTARARVCDTPEEFYEATQLFRGPFRALVVEDAPEWRSKIVAELRRLPDCVVDEASTYEKALDSARRQPPHLVSVDLNVPKDGVGRPEHGVALQKELARELGGTSFVVLTSHDVPALRRELTRLTEDVEAGQATSRVQVLDLLRRRVEARAILLKQDGDTALKELRVHAWRLQQERRTGGALPVDDRPLHEVAVDLANWGLKINGVEVPNTARGDNRPRDHALLRVLALYANVPLRKQAILDYWELEGLLEEVADRDQRLRERIAHLRKQIENVAIAKEEVIATAGDGYVLRGHVSVTGRSPDG